MTVPPPTPEPCTSVTPACPVEGSLYGYSPSIGWNGFFVGFYGLCAIIHIILGLKYRTRSVMTAMTLGCLGEAIGYGGRIIMWGNPFDQVGFQMQICCLIISPAFFSAAIYLTLKHIVLSFGQGWSRLPPSWFTSIFIGCDLLSLIMQGVGGGIAATADFGSDMQDVGTNLMIAGVVWQVVCLSFFGYLLGEYAVRTYLHRTELQSQAEELSRLIKFRFFVGGIIIAYITILARCAYRIPELTDGWGSELMRQETEFIILEGVMIAIAVASMTIAHPGYCFPAMTKKYNEKVASKRISKADSSVEMDELV